MSGPAPHLVIRPGAGTPGPTTRVWLGANALDRLPELVAEGDGRAVLLADRRVLELHGRRILGVLGEAVPVLTAPPGERSKSWSRLKGLSDALLATGLSRSGRVILLGGGMIGDLGGLAAALCRRGLPTLSIPTTLLAQIDAAYGGKVGVNHPRGKNLLGSFHHPVAVLAEPDLLETLPGREFRSALGELVKYGVLVGEELLARIEAAASDLARGKVAAVAPLITPCVEYKAGLVDRDERDRGDRALLNLGHTGGHALETLYGYRRLRHGEAVAVGLVGAARAAGAGGLEARLRELLARMGLAPRSGLPRPTPGELIPLLGQDKKGDARGLQLVLPHRPGSVEVVRGVSAESFAKVMVEVIAEPWGSASPAGGAR